MFLDGKTHAHREHLRLTGTVPAHLNILPPSVHIFMAFLKISVVRWSSLQAKREKKTQLIYGASLLSNHCFQMFLWLEKEAGVEWERAEVSVVYCRSLEKGAKHPTNREITHLPALSSTFIHVTYQSSALAMAKLQKFICVLLYRWPLRTAHSSTL